MTRTLDDLLLERGRLVERIAGQRAALRNGMGPVSEALGKVDKVVAGVHAVAAKIRSHPVMATVALGALFWFKGKSLLRWSGKAFSLWQSWRFVQATLADWGARGRS